MKLGISLLIIGLLGTLLMFLPAIEISNAEIYTNPWILAAGVTFFIIFLFGVYRVRKVIRQRNEERYRRR